VVCVLDQSSYCETYTLSLHDALPIYFLIWDLAGPAGEPLWILPILSGLTTYGQMMLTSTDPSQRAMMLIMPLFLTWISIQFPARSEEHTSELQSRENLVCRLLLEKNK